jgi:hypothetical protein
MSEWSRDENGKPWGLEGKTLQFATDGVLFYSNWVGTQLNGASTDLLFHAKSDYSYLDDCKRSTDISSNADAIREHLTKPRRSDARYDWRVMRKRPRGNRRIRTIPLRGAHMPDLPGRNFCLAHERHERGLSTLLL